MAGDAIRRIGVLTGGGDCPGLNAVIRGVTKPAQDYGMTYKTRTGLWHDCLWHCRWL